jgi:hypothetical protein
MPRTVERIILVYNGDSGLGAMLLDVLKKAIGREDCALCEITYSPVGKRKEWTECAARLGVPVDEMHRDELPAAWGIRELPCILGRAGPDPPASLLTAQEIAECRGSPALLEQRLRRALD